MTAIKQIGIMLMAALSLSVGSCSSSRQTSQETPLEIKDASVSDLPYAVVYRTQGDYNTNVPVTLNSDGTTILSYPDPRDVASERVAPITLNNGYLLDRRGISANTAFLDYTYKEYARLEKAPSTKELMEHIIAKNAVVELYRLPITLSEAIGNPARCNEFIANGFKDCKKIK